MATTPISELLATVELVRSMKASLDDVLTVMENFGQRLEEIERLLDINPKKPGA
jgi:hypothetical protein